MRAVARAALTAALRRRERALCAAARPDTVQPVFVLGPPRSGTTLLHELLVTRFHFAYFSRAAQALPDTPAAATGFAQPWIRRWRGNYTSRYGQLRGWGAPHEAARIWSRWMPGDGAVERGALDAATLDDCRHTVAAVAQIIDAPFVSKNPTHSVRIGALVEMFPGAAFIEVRRRPLDTVHSILAMREAWHGPHRTREWLAVRPRGCDDPAMQRLEPFAQVCAQVAMVRGAITADCDAYAPGRHFAIDYEDLCADPRGRLDAIAAFLERAGIVLDARGEVPPRFAHVVHHPQSLPMNRRRNPAPRRRAA